MGDDYRPYERGSDGVGVGATFTAQVKTPGTAIAVLQRLMALEHFPGSEEFDFLRHREPHCPFDAGKRQVIPLRF